MKEEENNNKSSKNAISPSLTKCSREGDLYILQQRLRILKERAARTGNMLDKNREGGNSSSLEADNSQQSVRELVDYNDYLLQYKEELRNCEVEALVDAIDKYDDHLNSIYLVDETESGTIHVREGTTNSSDGNSNINKTNNMNNKLVRFADQETLISGGVNQVLPAALTEREKTYLIEEEYGAYSDNDIRKHSQTKGRPRRESLSSRIGSKGRPILTAYKLALISNFFFVLGSGLYLWLSLEDYYWAQEAQTIPGFILHADDDWSWQAYNQGIHQQQHPAHDRMRRSLRNTMKRPRYDHGLDEFADEFAMGKLQSQAASVRSHPAGQQGRRMESDSSNTESGGAWDNFWWRQLPLEVKNAARTLGHNRTSWDNGLLVSTDNMSWDDLAPQQQAAAGVFGYNNKQEWDTGTPAPVDKAPYLEREEQRQQQEQQEQQQQQLHQQQQDEQQQNQSNKKNKQRQKQRGGSNTKGNERTNSDNDESQNSNVELYLETLPSSTSLEYNNQNNINENNDNHYNSPIVNTNTDRDSSDDDTTYYQGAYNASAHPQYWNNFYWQELPQNIQDAAEILGYTQVIWDSAQESETADMYWSELTIDQRMAAAVFGYDEESWNESSPEHEVGSASSINSSISPNSNKENDNHLRPISESGMDNDDDASNNVIHTSVGDMARNPSGVGVGDVDTSGNNNDTSNSGGKQHHPAYWNNFYWSELPKHLQAAASVLGYNDLLWDSNGETFTSNLFWSELTIEQQQAAEIFGYDEETWNEYEQQNSVVFTHDGNDYLNDDMIFRVGHNGPYVTEYMTIYFFAALCFVFVGILDWQRRQKVVHLCMVFAGTFGLISALLVEANIYWSNIFNSLSVHFFFLEAFTIVKRRITKSTLEIPYLAVHFALWTADAFFAVGALTDVVLSYLFLDETSEWSLHVAWLSVIAATLWLCCALIYTTLTIAFGKEH